jgi:hypothetical protein
MVTNDVWVDDHPTLEIPVVPVQPQYHPVAPTAPTMVSSARETAQDISTGIVRFLKVAWIPLKFVLKVVGTVLLVLLMLVVAIIPYLDPDPNGFRKN